ncbi:MAG: ATP-dependent DNA helicase RecG [Rhodobacteraceae bacterium]|nr:ATP-dependent DNA helicase RecG [Paracoccaceae bacterium]
MSGRPEILWPLFGDLEKLPGVGPKSASNFKHLHVEKPRDLIFTLPSGGIDRRPVTSIRDVTPPCVVTVEIEVGRHHPPAVRGRPYRVFVRDAKTEFTLIFFHAHADWLKKNLPTGQRRIISGKVELFDGMAQMPHPDHILLPAESDQIPPFEPVYPLTAGITAKMMTKAVDGALALAPDLPEWIDNSLKKQEKWPGWRDALRAAHGPVGAGDLSAEAPARRRLAYDELLAHQLTLAIARSERRAKKGVSSCGDGTLHDKIFASLPYSPTGAQTRAIAEIAADMGSTTRMSRLLQGDVGSGKTLVALAALLVAVEAGGQGAMMAPTEILARQHLSNLQPLAESAGVVLEILTGRDKGKERAAKLAALASGRIHILVGTHALFQKDVEFQDLRLAIIDEQHRFGVAERMQLGGKGRAVDVLVMTATPIPRSLELTMYGEMEVSILDEKPPGRTPVTTALVSAGRMDQVVDRLRNAVAEERQAYWVCPLVEESEVSDMTAAVERFKRLRAALGEGVVGLVHGQMLPAEKDAAMADFVAGKTQVLVATTVIEVGVDVPNASIMVIEHADRFGLAQLHQLRGRVGRGAAASTCLLMYSAPLSQGGRRRLETLRETDDGFKIAEADLEMRGAGDLIGTAQSGLPRFQVADAERQAALMAVAHQDARALLTTDPDLNSDRGLAARVLLYLMERDQAIRLLSVG